jgi:hypothetical protein
VRVSVQLFLKVNKKGGIMNYPFGTANSLFIRKKGGIIIKRITIILFAAFLSGCVSTSGTVPVKKNAPVVQKKLEKIRVAVVRTFGAFEKPKQSDRVYTDQFETSETTYIWTELYVENLEYQKEKHEHDVVWTWLNSNGSQRGKMKGKLVVDPKWKYAWNSRGWGWDEPGKWPAGTYTAIVQVDGIEAGRTVFRVNRAKGYIRGMVPSYPGAEVLSEDKCTKGSSFCSATLQISDTKRNAYNYYHNLFVKEGWKMDASLSSSDESGMLGQKGLWGMINCNKGMLTLTTLFPSNLALKGKSNQVVFNFMDRGVQKDMAAFVKNIARYDGPIKKQPEKPIIDQMNQRFVYDQWSVTVTQARQMGQTITKPQYFNSNRPYRFSADMPGHHLVKVTMKLERNDGKPINETFMADVKVKDVYGRDYPWIGAGMEIGEYFDNRKKGTQSHLVPVQAKSVVEYVFNIPDGVSLRELVWMGQTPIGIVVK